MYAVLLSRVWLFATIWTVAHQIPLSVGFFRQEYYNGLPCPPPGDLPDPGIEPMSPVSPQCRQILCPLSHQGGPVSMEVYNLFASWSSHPVMVIESVWAWIWAMQVSHLLLGLLCTPHPPPRWAGSRGRRGSSSYGSSSQQGPEGLSPPTGRFFSLFLCFFQEVNAGVYFTQM